jgi:hypothetical protein
MAKRRKRLPTKDALMKRVLKSRACRGKHVVLMHGHVYKAASGRELTRLLDRVMNEFPDETPTLAYTPAADSLILVLG